MQLGCPTEDERDKPMTVDALKEEILINSGEDTCKDSGIRYWE